MSGFEPNVITGQCEPIGRSLCVAVAKDTACFPRDGQSDGAQEDLRTAFAAFVQAQQPDITSVSAVNFVVDDNTFYFVITSEDANAIALANALNVSTFTIESFCSDDQNPEPPSGFTLVSKTVRFVNIECAAFDINRIEEFRAAVAGELTSFGIRTTDVVVTNVECGSGSVVSFYVRTPTVLATTIEGQLAAEPYWEMVYDQLVITNSNIFLDGIFQLEYAPDRFVPQPQTTNSGDQVGSGQQDPNQGGL